MTTAQSGHEDDLNNGEAGVYCNEVRQTVR